MKLRKRRSAKGQALVEFALVLPIFIFVILGTVEVGLIAIARMIYTNATNDAAHSESLAGTRNDAIDTQVVAAIRQSVATYPVAHLVKIENYPSDAQGSVPQNGIVNTYDGNGQLQGSLNWPVSSRISTLSQTTYVGVRLTYQYTWLTSFVSATGATLTLQTVMVMPLTPLDGS